MNLKCIAALALTTLASACGIPVDQASTSKHVIGVDDRVSVDQTQYPYSAIGKLKLNFANGTSSFCTASLVGPDVAITAAHCLYSAGALATKMEFFVQYSYGSSPASAKVLRQKTGTSNSAAEWAKDWALLKLDRDLGSTYGTLGIYGLAAKSMVFPAAVDLAGYSTDVAGGEALSTHLGCQLISYQSATDKKIPKSRWDTISHNCDLQTGASGAPLITYYEGFPYVFAIQSYHFSDAGVKGNGAVATDAAYDAYGSL